MWLVLGLLLVVAAGQARAADEKKIADQLQTRNKAAVTAYEAGNFDKMKAQLLKAIVLGEENGMTTHPMMAQTYLLVGVMQAEMEDKDASVRYFGKALAIAPDAQIPQGMGTTPVKKAFKEAREKMAAHAEAPPPEPAAKSEPPAKARQEKAPPPEEAEEEAPKPRQSSGGGGGDRQCRDERANLQQDLAQARKNEARERSDKEGLAREKEALAREVSQKDNTIADLRMKLQQAQKDAPTKDKQIAEMKGSVMQAERERAYKEKQLADTSGKLQALEREKPERERQLNDAKTRVQVLEREKADLARQLAQMTASEARERQAKEKLQAEKPDREKQLAEAKSRVKELEKDKADRDKWLAESKGREQKLTEANQKLERQTQFAQLEERERKGREDRERLQRAKLEAGPDLPSRVPEPVYCALPDEAEAGADLWVHCVPQPNVRAKSIAFFYRESGTSHYNSVTLDRTKKGWYTTVIPANRVAGKSLQYYAEARDSGDAVVASNGKSSSPNILPVRRR
jgi:hypothetical protein